jgi:RNA polymerase sigma-70 factor (ECF subfamily)
MELTATHERLEELVRQAAGGDPDAFTELVRRTQDRILRTARALVGDREAAEDAAQEAYLTAWERLADLRDPARFPAWLARILTRIALARRKRRGPARLGDAAAVLPDREGPDHARLDALQREVERLPDRYRAPLALHYLAGLPYRDVAEALGISEKRVKSRLHDARARLRRRLGTEERR